MAHIAGEGFADFGVTEVVEKSGVQKEISCD